MKSVSFCYDYDSNDEKHVSIECSVWSYSVENNLILLDFGHIRYYIPFDSLYYIISEDI